MKKEDDSLFLAVEAMINSSMKQIRNQQAMTTEDIAKLYEVTPKEILQKVKSEITRFPSDFMLRLTKKEKTILETDYPYAFTDGGILMLGGQLRSKRSIQIHMQFINYFFKVFDDFYDKIKIDDPQMVGIFELFKRMRKK